MAFNLTGADQALNFRQGTDISVNVEIRDDNGTPLDLTGYTAEVRIGPDVNSTAEVTLTVGNGITIDEEAGIVTYTLTNAQTDAFTFTQGRYDLEIIDSNGKIDPVVSGKVTIAKRVPN